MLKVKESHLSWSGSFIWDPLCGRGHGVEAAFRVLQCQDGFQHHGAQAACICTLTQDRHQPPQQLPQGISQPQVQKGSLHGKTWVHAWTD